MKPLTLSFLVAVAVLGLQGCEVESSRTTVTAPQASLPDDTVLRGTAPAQAPDAASAAAPAEAPPAPAPADTATATAPSTDPAPAPAVVPPDTSALGGAGSTPADPKGPEPAPGAGGAPTGTAPDGVAAPTEMMQVWPPAQPASAAAPAEKVSSALPAVRSPGDPEGARLLAQRALLVPVAGIVPASLADNYDQSRGGGRHEAIDILAPAGTPVVAVDDGRVAKLFTSKPGGLTVYQFDPQDRLAYYYAHLQAYAGGLREGAALRRGDLIGYVGTSGNADPRTPHLHFAVFRLGSPPKWWQGEPVNPWPALSRAQPVQQLAAR